MFHIYCAAANDYTIFGLPFDPGAEAIVNFHERHDFVIYDGSN